MAGNEISQKPSTEIEDPTLQTEQYELSMSGIVIQLTGTKGERDSLEESDLIVTLDRNNQKLHKSKSSSNDMKTEKDKKWALHSPLFHVPLSPSSPGSLRDCSTSSPSSLSPSHQPLVKSLSTELQLKDTSSLKPRPLISLVKSISTELSYSSPEVSQSKSDSKLSLHLWTQLIQSKGRIGESRTAPPSPVNLYPTEAKAGFFKMELEDTCRKLTEAMHEPLSVFSKIIGEDSTDMLKHQRSTGSNDPTYSKWLEKSCGELSGFETIKVECEGLAKSNQHVRPCMKCIHCRSCHSNSHLNELEGEDPVEDCTYEDAVHDVMAKNKSHPAAEDISEQSCSPVPGMSLSCVAVLLYCYFILPLSSYWSGIFVGMAFGFMLGLLLIRLGLTKHRYSVPSDSFNQNKHDWIQGESKKNTVKGWINEMYTYDPETYHPSLMHSVYLTLEGDCIRLDYPRSNIPPWATFNEPFYDQSFTHSRRFHLDGSKVFLSPPTLAQKRVWNRKYPICITVATAEQLTEDQQDPHFSEKLAKSQSKTNHNTTLYLFARTGREKEEWFHYLCTASMYRNEGQHDSDVSVLQDEKSSSSVQVTGSIENISAMSDLISSDQGRSSPCFCNNSRQGSPSKKNQRVSHHGEEMQSVWMNALIGRIFWDFLCQKYWSDQVAHKIQCKLGKIRLPYFMDKLTVTELSLGSCMPQITDLFQPQVNGRGLWLHLNIEYKGALQMTLETKINLSKIGKEELEAVRDIQVYHVRYSFCVPPKLDLRVQPKLGEREMNFCHVTEWIEKKLQDEFQKVFVLPNMDDIKLPFMRSAFEGQSAPEPPTLLL